ncbi:hypothetical protein [Acetobacterium sp.]|uniref:hypothetical protein n=1 Tax=Acetobacterium sp. TaxID=1872094 RepID=UPI00359399DA
MLNRSKTLFLFSMILILGLAVLLSGCNGAGTKNKAVNKPDYFYSQVELGMEKSQVESTLGVKPEEENDTYIYRDEQTGFGVQISYDASDLVTSKILYHEDDREIMGLSDASVSEDQLASITEGMSYDEVKGILGSEGTEMIQMSNPIDPNNPIVMMTWFNNDQTGFYVTFAGIKGTVVTVKFWK